MLFLYFFAFLVMIKTTFANENELHVVPYRYISYRSHAIENQAIPLTPTEEKIKGPCSFVGYQIYCPIEFIEHEFVRKYVLADDQVLETGGRFGTTSCEIASKQKNSGKLIVVEPDSSVWDSLIENRHNHFCNFFLLKGTIGNSSVVVTDSVSYATRAKKQLHHQASINDKNYFNLEEIQKITNVQLNVLLIDCEGCIQYMFEGEKDLGQSLKNIRLILLEGDMAIGEVECKENCVDYSEWQKKFESIGFAVIEKLKDPVFPSIYHYVFKREKEYN